MFKCHIRLQSRAQSGCAWGVQSQALQVPAHLTHELNLISGIHVPGRRDPVGFHRKNRDTSTPAELTYTLGRGRVSDRAESYHPGLCFFVSNTVNVLNELGRYKVATLICRRPSRREAVTGQRSTS